MAVPMPRETSNEGLRHDSNNLRKWEYGNGIYQRALSRYLDRLGALLLRTGAGTVLDAGCGEGFVQRAMRARGFSGAWTGVDASAGAVAFAAERAPRDSWRVGDLRALPDPSASYDVVLCSQVLEHIPDPTHVRDELARVTGRWLLISVPLEPVFRTACALSIALGIGQDPGHVNFWTPTAFRRFLEPAGRLVTWERTTAYQLALVETRALLGS
jgi:SAM-dependent methyltransferase